MALLSSTLLAQTELQIGYGAFTFEESGLSPAASALFSLRNPDGVLVSEAGVAAVQLVQRGRIFVQEDASRQTGIALVNLFDESNTVQLILRDLSGQVFAEHQLVLDPNEHMARFVRELFDNVDLGISFEGDLTFEADPAEPGLAAITLRQSLNAAGETVFTTLPVAHLGKTEEPSQSSESIIFPQIGVGMGLSTQLVLISRSDVAAQGTIRFFTSEGQPLELRLGAATSSELPFMVAPNGAFFAQLESIDPSQVEAGYAIVEVEDGPRPAGSAIFRFVDSAGSPISEAGVGVVAPTIRARLLIDNFQTRTGLALANLENAENTVEFDLLDANGTFIETTSRELPAQGHLSIFAHELFDLEPDFVGLMEIRSDLPIAPVSLKLTINGRNQSILTTLPVADLEGEPVSGSFVFPQMAFGVSVAGDFSTRLSLISAETNEVSEATLNFWTSDGQPWDLDQVPPELPFAVGAGERGDILFRSPPEPIVLQRGNSDSALLGPEGGIVSVENQRGDIITLRVPPQGLLQNENITVTALISPPKQFLAQNVFPGVLLEPEGLVFNEPARLEVQLTNSLPRPEATRLSWVASDSHLIPAGNQLFLKDVVEAEVDHFSVFTGDQWTLSDAVRYLGILLDPDFQEELRQRFPDFRPPDLDESFLELLSTLEFVDAIAELEKLREALGADAPLADILGLLEEGVLRFLESEIPAEPCAEYHSFLRELIKATDSLLEPEIAQGLQQRLTAVDDQCISIDLTGRWIVESFESAETCRLIQGCPEGICEWQEEDDEPPLPVDVVQQGSDFLISFPDFPQVGSLGGRLQATGIDFQPYSFTVEDSSSTTFDCMIFFQTSGLGIDFGAPLCGGGVACTPLSCQETVTVTGLVSADGQSFLGLSYWDFLASVREARPGGPSQILQYRCRGAENVSGEKIE